MIRVKNKIKWQISGNYNGICSEDWQNDSMFVLKILVQRITDFKEDFYLYFVEHEKSIHNVRYKNFIQLLTHPRNKLERFDRMRNSFGSRR